jgi:hypothetical protein
MADIFTPESLLRPLPTVRYRPPAARSPTPKWIEDYFGPKPPAPTGAGNLGVNGIDGIWWPPGQAYQYVGRQLYFDGSEVPAGSGFTLIVPDGELWRINWLAVDWITNTGSGTRFFLLQVLDFNNTGFGSYVLGSQKPTDNDGGTVTFLPGVQSTAPVTQQIMEPLPRPLLVYSQWRLKVQINNGGADFLNSLRADIERWLVVPAPTGAGGTGTGGGSSNPFGGPYFVEG